jgi:Tfp pilus assembly protein PilF
MDTKRYQKSEENFKKAITLLTPYPEAHNNLGVLYNRIEKHKEAITEFEKALAIERYSTPENAFTNMGYAYFKLGNLNKAKAYQQKALDLTPEFCLAQKNLADIYSKEKKYEKASEYYQKASTTCPLYEESQYKLGLTLMKLGNKRVAKLQFEQLIDKHKQGPYVDRASEFLKFLH